MLFTLIASSGQKAVLKLCQKSVKVDPTDAEVKSSHDLASEIQIQWTPAHVETEGNEEADSEANKAK